MIKIKETDLITASKKGIDEFLQVFTDAYLQAIDGELCEKTMPLLTGNQHALLSHRFFSEEIREGGFVQLIQNGYGAYIFQNPFAKAMRLFGAKDLSKLIYKAKEIYDANKTALERETTEAEFTALYVDFEIFDELEEQYFEIEEEQTAIIASYVDEHIGDFAEVV